MITELTNEQKIKLAQYRGRYLRQAALVEPEDREQAEVAVRGLAEIIGIVVSEIEWVESPIQGSRKCKETCNSFLHSLNDSFDNSLRNLFDNSVIELLFCSLGDLFSGSLRACFWDLFKTSLWDAVRASSWLAYYSYAVEVLGIPCSAEYNKILRLFNEVAASCFAVWVVSGKIILCKRPIRVSVMDNMIITMEWEKVGDND